MREWVKIDTIHGADDEENQWCKDQRGERVILDLVEEDTLECHSGGYRTGVGTCIDSLANVIAL